MFDGKVSAAGPLYKTTSSGAAKGLKPIPEPELQRIIELEVENAVNFITNEVSATRIIAEAYYQGQSKVPIEEGRSEVVVTKVRDSIQGVLPSVARVLTSTDTIVEFSSNDEEDEVMCTEATIYCNDVFNKNEGYTAMLTATTDALKAKIGVVKCDYSREKIASHATNQYVDQEQLDELDNTPDVVVTEQSPPDEEGIMEVVITRHIMKDCWTIETLPPETFIIDSEATTLKNSRIHGERVHKRVSDIVEMGFDFQDIISADADHDQMLDNEKDERKGYSRNDQDDTASLDPGSKMVLYGEYYVRVDADGDGVAELRRFRCVGSRSRIIEDVPVDQTIYAVFKTTLQPHVFHPISMAEDLQQDQDAQTALLRSILNNAYLVNSPRTEVNENMVNLEDAKSTEIGAMIRVKAMGMINELATPFVAGQTLPVLQYLGTMSEERSGVNKLSQGLDPDALQSSSRIAANATVMGGEARIELMVRNIAETGMKDLFMIILRTAMMNIKRKVSIKTQDGYQKVTPNTWHDYVNCIPHVGLGTGRPDEKRTTLSASAATQQALLEKLGLDNPICNWNNLRNTYKAMFRLSGIRNISDYFPQITQGQLKAYDAQQRQEASQQAQAQQQATLVDAQAYAKAELDKVTQKAQEGQLKHQREMQKMQGDFMNTVNQLKLEIAKLKTDSVIEIQKILTEDDQKRDEAYQSFVAAMAKIGADITMAKTETDKPRGSLEARSQ